jgi:hypothetical protein
MVHLIVRHTVEDYARWKPLFDGHSSTRQTGGSKGALLFRNADSPNELIIVMEWDSLDNARKFAFSDDLRQTMEKAGVADRPDIYFVEQVDKSDA